MDCEKVGKLIKQLRKEHGYTQQQVANALNISNKTVSKWENGFGCPDVSLLGELSIVLGVDLEQMLKGRLRMNQFDNGNMKRVKFYVCPFCGNVLTGTGSGSISCCGRKLTPLIPKMHLSEHTFTIKEIDLDYYVSSKHPMSKEHYITFIACVGTDKVLLNRLYPEQSCAVRIPLSFHKGIIYAYCTEHGLWAMPMEIENE